MSKLDIITIKIIIKLYNNYHPCVFIYTFLVPFVVGREIHQVSKFMIDYITKLF